jgi:hypothetical protein
MAKRKPARRAGQGKNRPRPATALKLGRITTRMRSEGVSLTRAAHEEGVSPATVLRHAQAALRKTPRGTYKARTSDRLLRVLVIPTPDGLAEIATRDSRAATLIAKYWNAVNQFLETGDETDLARFRGVSIVNARGETVTLLTDLGELERLGSAGVLSFQSIYARVS